MSLDRRRELENSIAWHMRAVEVLRAEMAKMEAQLPGLRGVDIWNTTMRHMKFHDALEIQKRILIDLVIEWRAIVYPIDPELDEYLESHYDWDNLCLRLPQA